MTSLPPQFLETLRCPSSGLPLSQEGEELVCAEARYPIVGGVPWLLSHPRNSILDWGAKLNHFQQTLLQEISQLEVELKKAKGQTFERLQRLHQGKKNFIVEISKLFEPLIQMKVAAQTSYNALLDRAPSTQNLLSYEANIYRDWLWGEEENQLSKDLVLSVIDENPENFCVLGAGACRLAVDVHQALSPKQTVATDINPLFLLAVNKLIGGENFSLTEFPLHPINLESTCVSHIFKGLEKPLDNFHLCFADAVQSPFEKASFDTLLTPWLIDIQPHELTLFMKRLNRYLPLGGAWINFGSLVFNQNRDVLCYSIEEIETLAIDAGFEIEKIKQAQMPYLKSPYNAGHRVETVWAWRAKKVNDIALNEGSESSLQVLPEWILDTSLPVPRSDELVFSHTQYQFLNEMLGRVNGANSIRQLSEHFAKQQQADADEFERILISYFLQNIP